MFLICFNNEHELYNYLQYKQIFIISVMFVYYKQKWCAVLESIPSSSTKNSSAS